MIKAALDGEDLIALLPTGGGKTICFQVPALCKEGICLVISPLIALMHDQLGTLKAKGIPARALTGGMSLRELDTELDNCIYGRIKFLYLSPERLQQDLVQERIRQMKVNFIAVDEAHCISQWGHDFRPSYREIILLRTLKPEVPFMALTATATPRVVEDIAAQLGMKQPRILTTSFSRENLSYQVLSAEDKKAQLLQLMSWGETAIVYVRSRKATLETAAYLNKHGFKAEAFHGGMATAEKQKHLKAWLGNNTRIMVATTAFGMGIDKPDVRLVIHLDLPDSLENYFQEAGRAGRDGKTARSIILTRSGEISAAQGQLLSGIPRVEDICRIYRKLNAYFSIPYGEGEQSLHDFNFDHFCQQYGFQHRKTYNTLQILDRCGILKFSEQYRSQTSLQFLVSSRGLNFYAQEHKKFQALIPTLLRTYPGILEHPVSIDLPRLSSRSGIRPETIFSLLQELTHLELASFTHSRHDAAIEFLVPREDEKSILPLSSYIKKQQKTKEASIMAVLGYMENEEVCRSRQLLNYFGEINQEDCGICSVCMAAKKPLTSREKNQIFLEIRNRLQDRKIFAGQLVDQLPFPRAHVLEVLRLLEARGLIIKTSTNQYRMNQ